MDALSGNWHHPLTDQPPVNVRTPYTYSNISWAPSAWVRDSEAQTLSLHDLVREVLVSMVVDRIRNRGLPLMSCVHTRGLQLENIVNNIVMNHSVVCVQPRPEPAQEPYKGKTMGIPLQDPGASAGWEEEQRVTHMMDELTAALAGTSAPIKAPTKPPPGAAPSQAKQQVQFVPVAPAPQSQQQVQSQPTAPAQTKQVQRRRTNQENTGSSVTLKKPRTGAPGMVHQCEKCSKTFTSAKEMRRHQVVHTVERPFKCEKCSMGFKSKRACTKHYDRVHINKYPHYCKVCGKGMITPRMHDNLHGMKKDEYKCKYCDKILASSRVLNDHLSIHEPERKVKCDMCNQKVRPVMFRKHIRLEHNAVGSQLSNKCLTCDLELVEFKLLLEHLKEKHRFMFQCSKCEVLLRTEALLKEHEKEHLKPVLQLKCDKCSSVFTTVGCLRAHKRAQHPTPQVTYKCDMCGKVCKTLISIQNHWKKDHPPSESTFQCEKCQLMFVTDKSLQKHMHGHQQVELSEVSNKKGPNKKRAKSVEDDGEPSKQAFTIYTDSAAKVADLIRKGQMKVKVNEDKSVALIKTTGTLSRSDSSTSEKSDSLIQGIRILANEKPRVYSIKTAAEVTKKMTEKQAKIAKNISNVSCASQTQAQGESCEKSNSYPSTNSTSDELSQNFSQVSEKASQSTQPSTEKVLTVYTKTDNAAQKVAEMHRKGNFKITIEQNSKTISSPGKKLSMACKTGVRESLLRKSSVGKTSSKGAGGNLLVLISCMPDEVLTIQNMMGNGELTIGISEKDKPPKMVQDPEEVIWEVQYPGSRAVRKEGKGVKPVAEGGVKRGRGRPRKVQTAAKTKRNVSKRGKKLQVKIGQRRGRGRPRKAEQAKTGRVTRGKQLKGGGEDSSPNPGKHDDVSCEVSEKIVSDDTHTCKEDQRTNKESDISETPDQIPKRTGSDGVEEQTCELVPQISNQGYQGVQEPNQVEQASDLVSDTANQGLEGNDEVE